MADSSKKDSAASEAEAAAAEVAGTKAPEAAANVGDAADEAASAADAGAQEPSAAPQSQGIAVPDVAPAPEDDEDYESEDSLTFSNGVIEKIVAIAMRDVPGVLGMKGGWINRVQETFGVNDQRKGVVVEVTPDSAVKVNISVLIEYGAYAPQVFEDVKKTVVKQVTGMTGLRVAGVNLRIEDVLTPEEYAAGRREETDALEGIAAPAEPGKAEADDAAAASASDDADVADAPASQDEEA